MRVCAPAAFFCFAIFAYAMLTACSRCHTILRRHIFRLPLRHFAYAFVISSADLPLHYAAITPPLPPRSNIDYSSPA